MIPPGQYLRDIAAHLHHGVTITHVHGQYVAGKLADIAAQDERDAHEMRDAAIQLAVEIAALKGATPDQRASLRRYANLLAKLADHRAPSGSVLDPDEDPEPSTVLEFTSWPPARPRGTRLQVAAP